MPKLDYHPTTACPKVFHFSYIRATRFLWNVSQVFNLFTVERDVLVSVLNASFAHDIGSYTSMTCEAGNQP